jgi:hypothetical protein
LISVVGAATIAVDTSIPKPPGPDERRHLALTNALRSLRSETEYDPLVWEGFLD